MSEREPTWAARPETTDPEASLRSPHGQAPLSGATAGARAAPAGQSGRGHEAPGPHFSRGEGPEAGAISRLLDRPIWSALATRHADLAEGGGLARRYPASIVPFAAAGADTPESLRAFEALVGPDDSVILLQADPIVLPAGLVSATTATAVQMVAGALPAPVADARIAPLVGADAAEMLALAALTKPGPFTLGAQRLGRFWGVKVDGRLVAMAGERLRQPGLSELSGVCTHPEFRGGNLARLLSVFVAHQILERGETPYLHAYATNAVAIRLYESIGFHLRTAMNVAVVQSRDQA